MHIFFAKFAISINLSDWVGGGDSECFVGAVIVVLSILVVMFLLICGGVYVEVRG